MTVNEGLERFGYDVFLSYNNADKNWVRELADCLADTDYNGRPLRPWMDEQVINPGDLSGKQELTSALDRSRFLAIVLSPGSTASSWVNFELEYFINKRGNDEVLPLLKQECAIPSTVSNNIIDFTESDKFDIRLPELLAILRPAEDSSAPEQARNFIDATVKQVVSVDPGGLWPDPTTERDTLLTNLLNYDIDSPSEEGLAVAAFTQAALRVAQLNVDQAPSGYNMKMLLGDCLTACILQSSGYRQITQRLIDIEDDQAFDPVMYFSVARALSKLAELDASRIDVSVLLRLASRLDASTNLTGPRQAIAMMIGHVVGKIRNSNLGELLLKTLSEMGPASKMAVAIALSVPDMLDESVFYVSELKRLAEGCLVQDNTDIEPPSPRLLSLFFDLQHQNPNINQTVENAKQDISKTYGIDDFPYPYFWTDVRSAEAPAYTHNAPFAGHIVKVTTRNMVQLADRIEVSDVVCLTEPRIVDALFNNAGALLVIEEELDSIRSHRLRSRSIPFSTIDRETMENMQDGDLVVVKETEVKIMKAANLA